MSDIVTQVPHETETASQPLERRRRAGGRGAERSRKPAGSKYLNLVNSLQKNVVLTPEALDGGPIARIRDGDMIRVDAVTGRFDVLVDPAEFAARPAAIRREEEDEVYGMGRELFEMFRQRAGAADLGAGVF